MPYKLVFGIHALVHSDVLLGGDEDDEEPVIHAISASDHLGPYFFVEFGWRCIGQTGENSVFTFSPLPLTFLLRPPSAVVESAHLTDIEASSFDVDGILEELMALINSDQGMFAISTFDHRCFCIAGVLQPYTIHHFEGRVDAQNRIFLHPKVLKIRQGVFCTSQYGKRLR